MHRADCDDMQAPGDVPAALHTGRARVPASGQPQKRRGAAALVMGEAASPCTWRGLTRLALVGLVAAEEPNHSEPAPLAETLALDAREPLHPLFYGSTHDMLLIGA